MSKLISDYIKPKNFSRCEHYIYLRNETSSTSFAIPEKIKIIELLEKGLTLELPKNICQAGHNLTLFFVPNTKRDYKIKVPTLGHIKEAEFEIIGKIEKISAIENESEFISAHISFTQYNVKMWKKLLQKHSDNQNDINQLVSLQHGGNEDDN